MARKRGASVRVGSGGTRLEADAVGFPTALATAVGLIIASSVLLTATTGFGVGGWVFAVAILIAYVLMVFQSMSFSEAAGVMPLAGSVYDYIASGLGRFLGVTGTLVAYLVVHLFAGTAETAAAGLFASVTFPFLEGLTPERSWVVGVGLLLVFGVINALGIRIYGAVEVALTGIMWVTLLVFGLLGVLRAATVDTGGFFGESFVGTDLTAVLSMVGLAMFLFVGVEFVTPLASELRDPGRSIPRAMFIGLTAVAASMVLYGVGVLRQVENVELDGGVLLFETPLPIPAFAEQVLGTFGRWWLAIAVLFAAAATINTLLAGIPRILYGMAKDNAFPPVFAWLHPRYKAPWAGIALAVVIPAVHAIVIQGDIDSIIVLILAAVCAWLFAYVLVNISMIRLRARRPDLPRPFKTPWFPVPQILATIGMLITIWYIAPPGIARSDVYVRFFGMLAVCALFALWQTIVKTKKPLFEPVEPEDFVREEVGTA
ncbi:APC family permease [Egicoccus sp. AB-alg6-2]|uniref:APC family permease n=1 Tax=Egicoccus sp. AB-alg6-2 TaxID=3242692 RepID=UPI00359DD02C